MSEPSDTEVEKKVNEKLSARTKQTLIEIK
jgi:hypothetical protein